MHAAFARRREARLSALARAHPLHLTILSLMLAFQPRWPCASALHRLGLSCCARPTSCSVCTMCWQAYSYGDIRELPLFSIELLVLAAAAAAKQQPELEPEPELEQRQQRQQRRQQQQSLRL